VKQEVSQGGSHKDKREQKLRSEEYERERNPCHFLQIIIIIRTKNTKAVNEWQDVVSSNVCRL